MQSLGTTENLNRTRAARADPDGKQWKGISPYRVGYGCLGILNIGYAPQITF